MWLAVLHLCTKREEITKTTTQNLLLEEKKNKLETEYSFLEVETSVKPKNAKMLFWKPQKKNERYITNQT